MHIPSSMLHGNICPVTAAVSAAGIVGASYLAYRCREKPSVTGFSTVTAMIFAVQMLNYPISHGTSGHLLGGVMAASILGIPFAVLSMAVALSVQAVFFADGGMNTLGANILNMGLIGAGLSGGILYVLRKNNVKGTLALAMTSWLSVVLAASACSIELSVSKVMSLKDVLPAMVSIHAIIGMGEAVATVVLMSILVTGYAKRSMILALVGALLTPLSSQLPDGLMWISTQKSFPIFENFSYQALMAGYIVPAFGLGVIAKIAAALVGVFLVFISVFILASLIKRISLTGGQYERS